MTRLLDAPFLVYVAVCAAFVLTVVFALLPHVRRQAAVAAPTVTDRHIAHYRGCNCLADADICCVLACPCHAD